ncbi:hypothetical protein [Nocardioides sp.]|uniref:hypothetical protein n=1 Tax=Nocardioides sp. TaxID=35761 RepID=UPI002C3219A2|nr:hypothetical protein [Nocardioides sp.]HSX68521.1 hypothetical protein [Nocardioides sp.]
MTHTVAADTVTKYQSKAIGGGRIVAPAPLIMPGRWTHAVAAGADVTRCGRDVVDLREFPDLVFETVNPYLRCRACQGLIDPEVQ